MNIEFYCPLWGNENTPFEEFVARVKRDGYDGVEMSFPDEDVEIRNSRVEVLKNADLKLIGQHWETQDPDPKSHAAEYERRLRFVADARPEFISSQTGRDFFDFEDNLAIISAANRVVEDTGVNITHETHRSKLTFAAPATRHYLDKLPEMRLTLDVSHWFCVHERYLDEQPQNLSSAIGRTDHIHARVGHIEGSQVIDFRMPEWKEALEAHLDVWDRVVALAETDGRERLTVTPEFGPAPYMLYQSGGTEPQADQWELNVAMKELLKDRWT